MRTLAFERQTALADESDVASQSEMKRSAKSLILPAVLAAAAGAMWFILLVGRLGSTCGYSRTLKGAPHAPPTTTAVVLILLPVVLAAALAIFNRYRPWAVLGWMAGSAVMAALAVGVAEFVFAVSRHCFE